ncbi:MAG: DUF1015 domain-containing protein [Lachnospiraceae bacterium]|nr:DUF1015 domain-containing protein [Lachnospiraceae bacterium]MBQ9123817.1 DUF1015 domain-containing protein [Lachnospiraceae bacterium]
MTDIRPFKAFRPIKEHAHQIAALPYDVYNRQEAKAIVNQNPLSFLAIDRAETAFGEDVDTYADQVYAKAKELLDQRTKEGYFVQDIEACYYLYELSMDGRSQMGIVGCASIDDYLNNVIKKHENTRADKELDRIRHVDTCDAQTGPIFLAYREQEELKQLKRGWVQTHTPEVDFVSEDGVGHRIWKIDDPEVIAQFKAVMSNLPGVYIADGHHRCASAVRVGIMRREQEANYTGEEEFNFFLSVLFPDEELMIMDYNRVVKDLNGYTEEEFLEKVSKQFEVTKLGAYPVKPNCKGQFGMYLGGEWYVLVAKPEIQSKDPVKGLDVSVLQDNLLAPILGIQDPKTDKRIDFVGGIRGLQELERRANSDMKVAFSMYPTSIAELFSVADAGLLMPPKSTWFEPKLRSGFFVHKLTD